MKKVIVNGQACIVIERNEHYTKVLTPMHDILNVSNNDITEG